MTRRLKSESFVTTFERFIKILHLSCLRETKAQATCEAVEEGEASRVTKGEEIKHFAITVDIFVDMVRLLNLFNARSLKISTVDLKMSDEHLPS